MLIEAYGPAGTLADPLPDGSSILAEETRALRSKSSLSSVVVVLLVAIPLVATSTASAAPRCLGRVATIVGTDRDDALVGTPGPDVIVSGDGIDDIDGRGGDDRICSGGRPDFVEGGAGDDRIRAGGGGDSVFGAGGDDRIWGQAASVEALFGGRGNDRIFGGNGSFDSLIGGPGDDLLDGGPGQDLAEFFESPAAVHGDLVTGVVSGHGSDRLVRIEGLVGSRFDDVLLGDQRSNLLVGEDGDDLIEARGSGTLAGRDADLLDGTFGDDTLHGGEGADIVRFEDSPDPVVVDLAAGTATGWGTDALSGIETVIGTEFHDTLTGDDGDNAFVPGLGDDVLDGEAGIDQVAYFDSFEPVTVDLAAGTAVGWGADALTSIEDATGSAHADLLVGDDGPNRITGGSGADTISGSSGDDVLIGNRGTDGADGGEGTDACDAETETACEHDPVSTTVLPPSTTYAGWGGALPWDVR
jgi:Ca2+-binding RTX toxin-like protein